MPPKVNAVNPAGEWNTCVLTCDGPHIRVELNGKVVQDLNIDDWDTPNKNPDGSKNKFRTALKDFKRTGHVGLQDHGAAIAFRNVKIKVLDKK